ncbi:MAG: dockerin type I repeat-containing protein, partial [Ruminococcus sp.]|nr:dockerin type I repeat-containing protein [Ruminococcus sp.]
NIPYEETNMKEYTEIHIIRDSYTDDEYFQLLQKIKEDTGHVIGTFQPDLGIRLNSLTDIENVLPAPKLLGDANEDGTVSLADAVFIMQVLSNPDDFQLTPQGMANADTDGDGVTVMDAFRIQEMMIE